MKNQKNRSVQIILIIVGVVVFVSRFIIFNPITAQGFQQSNWLLRTGAGVFTDSIYPGSDVLFVKPIPYIWTEYKMRYFDFFAGIDDGIGFNIKRPDSNNFGITIGINPLGTKRDPDLKDSEDYLGKEADEIKELLADTPKIESEFDLFGTVYFGLPMGRVASTVTFYPIKVEYENDLFSDRKYNGLTVGMDYESELSLLSRIFIETDIGLTWMNDEYAEAFHSVICQTNNLKAFKAQDGIRDIHASISLIAFLTEHVGVLLYGSGLQLLGDAADSPLTKKDFQPKMYAALFYNF
jgi:outer membrane scaffolding protein for murein synthesis (MipA/OmpV family)